MIRITAVVMVVFAFLAAAALPVVTAPAASDLPTVLVSRQLAQRAGLRTGDTVTLALDAAGSGATRFRVGGAYEPTPDPMRFTARRLEARMHLPDLNAITAAPSDPGSQESVKVVNVRLADPNDATPFASALAARAPGIFAQPTVRARSGSDPFGVLARFQLAVP